MKRTALPLSAALAVAALLGLLLYGLSAKGENRTIDDRVAAGERVTAPDRPLPMLDAGGQKAIADFRGKVVVLNFWATWCPPCEAETPLLQQTQDRIAPKGGTVLGIDYNDNEPDARAFVKRHHLTYPILRDVGGGLARSYGTQALPETFVIDRRGRIAAVHRGQLDRAWLDEHLPPLLSETS